MGIPELAESLDRLRVTWDATAEELAVQLSQASTFLGNTAASWVDIDQAMGA